MKTQKKKKRILKQKKSKNKKLAEAVRLLLEASPQDRLDACERSFPLFMGCYFSHFIKAPFADFHYDIMKDLTDIESGELYEYALVAFRFCAKTSILKAYLTWIACFMKRKYIVVTSYDQDNSDNILSDVANNLTEIGNELLFKDMLFKYGFAIFTKERRKDEMTVTAHGMYQLRNGVWFEAGSVNTVFRGRNKNGQRIDLIVMDDIENTRTVASPDITLKIRKQMDELRSASDILDKVSVIYLGNKISENGNIAFLETCVTKYPRFKYKEVPLELDDGTVTWKAFTPEKIVELKEQFADTYQAEFNNKPIKDGAIFKPNRDKIIACIENVPPKKDRIIIGMDTGSKKYIVVGDSRGLFINDYCDDYSQLEYYLNKYENSIAVLDGQGDPTKTQELKQKYYGRIYTCFFRMDGKNEEYVRLNSDEMTVIADRNRLITFTYDEFDSNRVTLHGELEYWNQLYIPHWTNMYRTAKMTATGMRKVWDRKGGDHKNGDHLPLATVYWRAGVAVCPEYGDFGIMSIN